MDERPSFDPEILEAIEVFRPGEAGQEDLALQALIEVARTDPNLAEHLVRIQRWDRRCAEAMREVAVPPGLAPRIIELLKRNEVSPPVRESASDSQDGKIDREAPASRDVLASTPRMRRRWRWGVPAGAAIVAAALAIFMFLVQDHRWSGPDELCRTAINLFDVPEPEAGGGLLVSQTAPPEAYPYSPHLLSVPNTRWRSIERFGGHRAVAYDLPLRGDSRATLYVLRGSAKGLPAAPPIQSQLQTRNLSAAAWQSGDLVYVLVVAGGERGYRALLESTARPWT